MALVRLVIHELRDDARLGHPRGWPGSAVKVTNRAGLRGDLAACPWPAGDSAETFLDWCAASLPEAWIQIRRPAPPSAEAAVSITLTVGMRGAKPDPHGQMRTMSRWSFPLAGW
ncbi:hypothetical protein [Methylobacterium sp. JK268]